MPIEVSVAYSPAPCQVDETVLLLPEGSTVAQALQASGLQTRYPLLDLSLATLGVWGRRAAKEQVLRAQDRVEVYRALRVDPKVARRERFVRQGRRSAGLFARQRAGGKASD